MRYICTVYGYIYEGKSYNGVFAIVGEDGLSVFTINADDWYSTMLPNALRLSIFITKKEYLVVV